MKDNLRGRDIVYTEYVKPRAPLIPDEEMKRQESSLKTYNLKDLEEGEQHD